MSNAFINYFKKKQPVEQKAARTTAEILAILDGNAMDSYFGAIAVNKALTQATVWACVRILSESIAQLPIRTQQRNGSQWADIDHDVLGLLAEPNDWQTQHEWMSGMVAWTELQGDGYSLKRQGRTGPVSQLLPLDSEKVEVKLTKDWALEYTYNGEPIPASQMLHLRNFGTNGYQGASTIKNNGNAIGLALAMEEHGAGVFKHGAGIDKVIVAPHNLDDESFERLTREWNSKYSGSGNAHKTPILEGGLDVKTIGMTNDDSQWLDSRKFSKSEIATVFGIPDFMLNSTEKSTTWGSGLEQLSRSFVRFTLQPRMNRISQTLARELLAEDERSTIRFVFDTDQMTMGEFESRMTGYSTAIQAGVLSPNETREIEGRNPRDGGDEYLTPMNMTTGTEPEIEEEEDDEEIIPPV